MASFVGAVRSGQMLQPGVDEALSSLRVADAVQRSLKSGKAVTIRA
jgi:predicted dehydrogenase